MSSTLSGFEVHLKKKVTLKHRKTSEGGVWQVGWWADFYPLYFQQSKLFSLKNVHNVSFTLTKLSSCPNIARRNQGHISTCPFLSCIWIKCKTLSFTLTPTYMHHKTDFNLSVTSVNKWQRIWYPMSRYYGLAKSKLSFQQFWKKVQVLLLNKQIQFLIKHW